uniref:DUF3703 domain-containing protein n=1 Tax=Cyanothece sp. (strain PCC 7425 / ATCC 29141) TaxID=395961 RepID=B8HMA5_CYAP4
MANQNSTSFTAKQDTKKNVREELRAELNRAKIAMTEQEFAIASAALGRAHDLGVEDPIAHTIVHWHMLKLAWQQRNFQEVGGQLLPTLLILPLAPFKSLKNKDV